MILSGLRERAARARLLLQQGARTEESDRLVQIRIHENAQDPPIRHRRNIDVPDRVREVPVLLQELCQSIAAFSQKRLVEDGERVVGIEREIPDSRFHQVLEEVGPEGEVGNVVPFLAGDLHEESRVVDVRIGHADPEPDVPAASPATGPHESELPLGQDLVELAHHRSHLAELLDRA